MANARLLVVEDDLDIANMLKIYFSGLQYDVDVANRGRDALEKTRQVLPHLIVLDIMLPDIDGYEVCRTLRTNTRTSHIPVIFLTQKDERSDKLQGLELGADDYITKPFDVQELRLRVRNALKRMSQGSLTNPVSGLPEGALVDERLNDAMKGGAAGVLLVSLENMDAFREAYGFVASDDVLRAVSVMITNTLREISNSDDFLGHLSPNEFVLVVPQASLSPLQERLRTRLEQSLDYFYPIKDRELASRRRDRLAVKIAEIDLTSMHFASLEQLKMEFLRQKR